MTAISRANEYQEMGENLNKLGTVEGIIMFIWLPPAIHVIPSKDECEKDPTPAFVLSLNLPSFTSSQQIHLSF